jgi:hypothetical protein
MAKVHKCEDCGRVFARGTTLRRHRARKTPCVQAANPGAQGGLACEDCGRTYSTKGNLTKHRKGHCGVRRAREAARARTLEEELRAANEELRAKLEATERELKTRLATLENAAGARGGNVNHGTVVNGNVDNSVKIVLNVWGRESYDHITPDRTREIVRALRTQMGGEDAEVAAVARAVAGAMAREIWVENPANRVAYLPNVKGDRARVRTARGWEERASRDVEEAMHKTTVYVTSKKQPMATARDLKLMTPLLEAMDKGPVARAGMRAALIEMRPERALRGPREGLETLGARASERQGPAEIGQEEGRAAEEEEN